MAVSERFNQALRRLGRTFDSYRRAPRTPDRVTELASSRARLEDARTDMADVRHQEGFSRPERSSPRWFDPRIGLGDSSWTGRVFAVIGVAVLAIGLLVGVKALLDLRGTPDVELVDGSLVELVEPADDGACSWLVTMELESNAAEQLRLRSIFVEGITVGALEDISGFETSVLRTGDTTVAQVVSRLPSCPDSAAEIAHGPIVVSYDSSGTRPIQTVQLDF